MTIDVDIIYKIRYTVTMDKLYLDTSIPSAYFDTSKKERQTITQYWFKNDYDKFDLYTSTVAIDEIDELQNTIKRDNIKKLIVEKKIHVLDISEEILKLSAIYIEKGAIPKSEKEDALHIATAAVYKLDFLASWNFKHIVSINPIRKIHEINQKLGYNLIEIGSLELFGGYKYGNL